MFDTTSEAPCFLISVRLDVVERFAGAKCGTRVLSRYGCCVDLCVFVVRFLVVANLPVVWRTKDDGDLDPRKRKDPENRMVYDSDGCYAGDSSNAKYMTI